MSVRDSLIVDTHQLAQRFKNKKNNGSIVYQNHNRNSIKYPNIIVEEENENSNYTKNIASQLINFSDIEKARTVSINFKLYYYLIVF